MIKIIIALLLIITLILSIVHIVNPKHTSGSNKILIDCDLTEPNKQITPAYFLQQAIDLIKDKNLKKVFQKYLNNTNLTYRAVVVFIQQFLPKLVYKDWPSVGLVPPLDIPTLQPFNSNFNTEWYYFNLNGYVTTTSDNTPKRFYMLRVVKRLGVKYAEGTENVPWLLTDIISLFIEGEKNIYTHVCAPSFSSSVNAPNTQDNYYSISTSPLKVIYTDNKTSSTLFNAITLQKDKMTSTFNGISLENDKIEISLDCTCNKSILLQGQDLDGLDPPASNFISKLSGASYLYYSWPSWKTKEKNNVFKVNGTTYIVQADPFELWLDHQGGTVKNSKFQLISQFATYVGARPLIFPGWNWFSIQLDNNVQFTGYSNKPWNNNKNDNKHQIKGTWSDKDGNLSWIHGTSTIDKWWTSPDSGTNFGTQYTIDLGNKGVYVLKGFRDDQRAPHEGIEQYEGGCDIYKDGKKIGVGNMECVGWPNLTERINFASNILKQTGLPPLDQKDKDIIYQTFKPSMFSLIFWTIIIWIIIAILVYLLFRYLNEKYWKLDQSYKKSCLYLTIIFVILVTFGILKIISSILASVLCNMTKTCSIGFDSGCLFNCRP